MPGNIEWYNECRAHAVETDSLESFKRCVHRVGEIQENAVGSGIGLDTVKWFRPMCHNDPTQLEFATKKIYGCIAIFNGNWSINT